MTLYHKTIKTPLGPICVETDEKDLISIRFTKTIQNGSTKQPKILKDTLKQLMEYFKSKRKYFDIKINFNKLKGSKFEKDAWNVLLTIPYGRTISYKDEALLVGSPKSCRAIGNANGKNPLPIVIPCHRVVASNGSLGGYSSGIKIKEKLLTLES